MPTGIGEFADEYGASNIGPVDFSDVTGTAQIAQGGTGATTAAQARSNLGIDLTALPGVTAIAQGGTGAATAAQARANLGVASAFSQLTGSASIAQGGTGATSASGARDNLGFLTVFNVKTDFGAAGDSISVADFGTTNTNTTVTSASFQAGHVGKSIAIEGAGSAGAPLIGVINSVTPGVNAVISVSASATLSNKPGLIGTDDSAAFQNAINAVDQANGGRIIVPEGKYFIAAAIQTTPSGIKNGYGIGQLILPTRNIANQAELIITFEGPQAPAMSNNWLITDSQPLSNSGAIIHSYAFGAQPTYGIFNGGPPTGATHNFAGIRAEFRNIKLRTYNNPKITPLNLGDCGKAHVENVEIHNGNPPAAVAQPTNGAYALIMPKINNWGIANCYNVDIYGYGVGIQWWEHADVNCYRIRMCSIGAQLPSTYHGSRANNGLILGCATVIQYPGSAISSTATTHHCMFGMLRWQSAGTGDWREATWHFDDPQNCARGMAVVRFVIANVGASPTVLKNGGAYLDIYNGHASTMALSDDGTHPKIVITDSVTGNTLTLGSSGLAAVLAAAGRAIIATSADAATTLSGTSSQITARNADTTANNFAKVGFQALDNTSAWAAAGAVGLKVTVRGGAGVLTGIMSLSTPNAGAPTEKVFIYPAGGVFIGTTPSDPGAGRLATQSGEQPASMADSSAANNTIYYSTTASKLVYKDSGGTVNALY